MAKSHKDQNSYIRKHSGQIEETVSRKQIKADKETKHLKAKLNQYLHV